MIRFRYGLLGTFSRRANGSSKRFRRAKIHNKRCPFRTRNRSERPRQTYFAGSPARFLNAIIVSYIIFPMYMSFVYGRVLSSAVGRPTRFKIKTSEWTNETIIKTLIHRPCRILGYCRETFPMIILYYARYGYKIQCAETFLIASIGVLITCLQSAALYFTGRSFFPK